MAFTLFEYDRHGNEKQRSVHGTLAEAMKVAEKGYGSFLGRHWQRSPPSGWVVKEPVGGGSWEIDG